VYAFSRDAVALGKAGLNVDQRWPPCAAIAVARSASVVGRQRGSDRVGSRHLAAGSRVRLCNRGAAPMPTRWRLRAFWIATER